LGEVVDTIGAGDAYGAAFLLGTLEGWPLERRALFASVAAGFTVIGVGGSQTFPERQRIEERVARLL
jgi:sugar/nucleoside kinase (ribokinase family)